MRVDDIRRLAASAIEKRPDASLRWLAGEQFQYAIISTGINIIRRITTEESVSLLPCEFDFKLADIPGSVRYDIDPYAAILLCDGEPFGSAQWYDK